jgi:hypothetical protein
MFSFQNRIVLNIELRLSTFKLKITYLIYLRSQRYEQFLQIIVLQATRDEFFLGQFLITIGVHFREDLIDFDIRRIRTGLFFAE